MRTTMRCVFPLLLMLLCVTAVLAQDEEINAYVQTWSTFPLIIKSIYWSAGYLLLYAAVLILTLSLLRLSDGFETEMLYWIGALWLGGLVITTVVYKFTHNFFLGGLLAAPLIFGYALLVNTRSFADLPMPDARRVALVIALICAPWFGPTLRTQLPHPKPPTLEDPGESAARTAPIAARIVPIWPVEG